MAAQPRQGLVWAPQEGGVHGGGDDQGFSGSNFGKGSQHDPIVSGLAALALDCTKLPIGPPRRPSIRQQWKAQGIVCLLPVAVTMRRPVLIGLLYVY